MVSISFLNPLSPEGEEIVRDKSILKRLLHEDIDLMNLVIHTKSQNISNDDYIPQTLAELALKRFEWFIRKKNDKNYDHNDYAFLFNPQIEIYDVITFYILAQAIGINFNPNSRESRLFIESQGQLTQERLEKLDSNLRKDMVSKLLNQLTDLENFHWTALADLLGSKKISLSDLIIDQGEVILDKDDFLERFEAKIDGRIPEKIYEILIGDKIKEFIIVRMIMQNSENYIRRVHQMASHIQAHPSLIQIGEEISKIFRDINFHSSGAGEIKASKLQSEAFPPCIKNTLKGVSSGNRNDAIVLLLTSFLSYARLYPSVFKSNITLKISDLDKGLKVTNQEILPLIYKAADSCNPPLFEDDPQEKLNITAKLGFGVHETLQLDNEGESKWYTPMSCDKIKIHLPQLCQPDKNCEKIGNPLTYYNRKTWIMRESKNQALDGEDLNED